MGCGGGIEKMQGGWRKENGDANFLCSPLYTPHGKILGWAKEVLTIIHMYLT